MAFMMPVMKKNYNIYGDRGGSGGTKRPSATEMTDGRKSSQGIAISSTGSRRRIVRSEGPSLSTSPASAPGAEVLSHAMQIRMQRSTKPVMMMRRARGSAPMLTTNSLPLHRNNSLPGGPSTAPVGSPAPISPTHSTGSSSSTSSETSGTHHRFHLKLLSRIRKSLRIKDPAPAAS